MKTARKAILAGVVALLGTLGTALADGTITPTEGLGIFIATAVAAIGVYQIPNEQPDTGEGV